jgi:branched-subunit amino acid transport protein AzlD
MGDLLQPWHLVVLLVMFLPITLIAVVPFWQIFKKAGFPAPLSLLMLVPPAGLVILFIVAFSDWPALRGSEERAGRISSVS